MNWLTTQFGSGSLITCYLSYLQLLFQAQGLSPLLPLVVFALTLASSGAPEEPNSLLRERHGERAEGGG